MATTLGVVGVLAPLPTLVVMSLFIFWEAWERLFAPPNVATPGRSTRTRSPVVSSAWAARARAGGLGAVVHVATKHNARVRRIFHRVGTVTAVSAAVKVQTE